MLDCDKDDKLFVGDAILSEFFQCKGCGICCNTFEPLPLYLDEIKQIVHYLGITKDEFRNLYTCKTMINDKEISLKTPCPFVEENSCLIYPNRGFVCRTFPFCINLSKNVAVLSGIYFCPQATQFYEGLLDFLKKYQPDTYIELIEKEQTLPVGEMGYTLQSHADIFSGYLDWLYNIK
jgi:Fe-S-cluster containining protein